MTYLPKVGLLPNTAIPPSRTLLCFSITLILLPVMTVAAIFLSCGAREVQRGRAFQKL